MKSRLRPDLYHVVWALTLGMSLSGCKSVAQTHHGDLDELLGQRIEDAAQALGNASPSVNPIKAYTWIWPDENRVGGISEVVVLYVDGRDKVVLWMQQSSHDELPRVGFDRHLDTTPTPSSATSSTSD